LRPSAVGQAEAIQKVADAERYRQLTVAEGEAQAIRSVYGAIHEGGATPDLIAIKYLEALQVMANGQATKIFLPADTSGFLGSLAGVAELLKDGGGNGSTSPRKRA
jgi:regulator of protease activity HflC (stomatin/prohibitin superfamily)